MCRTEYRRVDFKECRIRIIRKGGKEEYVYFGDDVADALENYIDYARSEIVPREGHEHALFYSIQRRRMTVQAIEDLVKEYATKVTTFKHIHHINFAAHMARHFTDRQGIFIL